MHKLPFFGRPSCPASRLAFDVVDEQILSLAKYDFDMAKANVRINEVNERKMNADIALWFCNIMLKIDKAGGCFNFSATLAYRLKKLIRERDKRVRKLSKICIITTLLPNGSLKCSVGYVINGKLYVADIIRYIEHEVERIGDISKIPFKDYVKMYPKGNVFLHDIDKLQGTYLDELVAKRSNTTPKELLGPSLPTG